MKFTTACVLLLGVVGAAAAACTSNEIQFSKGKDCKNFCKATEPKHTKAVFTPSSDDGCSTCTCCPERYSSKSCSAKCDSYGAEAIFKRGKNSLKCKKTCECLSSVNEVCDVAEGVICPSNPSTSSAALCLQGFCKVLSQLGENCQSSLGPQYSTFCEEGLTCESQGFLGGYGICVQYLATGESCSTGSTYQSPFVMCNTETSCMKMPIAPPILNAVSMPSVGGSGYCLPSAGLGEACNTKGSVKGQTLCTNGLQCYQPGNLGEPGVCRVEVGQGYPCKENPSSLAKSVYCYGGNTCHFGVCQNIVGAAEKCDDELPVELAIKCEKPLRCISNYCFLGASYGETCQETTTPQFQIRCKNAGAVCRSVSMGFGSSGKCVDEQPEGKKCNEANNKYCEQGLVCQDSRCTAK